MHLFDAQTHFYGGNAIVGGGLPLAFFLKRQPTSPMLNAALFDLAVLVALLWLHFPPKSLVGP